MKNRMSALVIGPPGRLRDSLQVLLTAIPRIERVSQADDVPSALAVGTESPAVVVLADGDLLATLDRIRAGWPHAKCVALVDDEQELEVAQAAGADVVLLRGLSAAKLIATIEGLLFQEEKGDARAD